MWKFVQCCFRPQSTRPWRSCHIRNDEFSWDLKSRIRIPWDLARVYGILAWFGRTFQTTMRSTSWIYFIFFIHEVHQLYFILLLLYYLKCFIKSRTCKIVPNPAQTHEVMWEIIFSNMAAHVSFILYIIWNILL